MTDAAAPIIFGPRGRRILGLVASPDGSAIALQQSPENFETNRYQETVYREAGVTFEKVGDLPAPPPAPRYESSMRRADFAPLPGGDCIAVETGPTWAELVRYSRGEPGMVETARWQLCGAYSISGATLQVLPASREAVIVLSDRNDKNVDWGGGPPPDFISIYLLVDVQTGEKRGEFSVTTTDVGVLSFPGIPELPINPSNPPPPWVATWAGNDHAALERAVRSLSPARDDFVITAGPNLLLSRLQVIEICSGSALVQLTDDRRQFSRLGVYPRFHALSEDEKYALSTVEGGHFELWNIAAKISWRPVVPEHGGVHRAIFLPEGRVALGTAASGVIIVDCLPGVAPGDTPWQRRPPPPVEVTPPETTTAKPEPVSAPGKAQIPRWLSPENVVIAAYAAIVGLAFLWLDPIERRTGNIFMGLIGMAFYVLTFRVWKRIGPASSRRFLWIHAALVVVLFVPVRAAEVAGLLLPIPLLLAAIYAAQQERARAFGQWLAANGFTFVQKPPELIWQKLGFQNQWRCYATKMAFADGRSVPMLFWQGDMQGSTVMNGRPTAVRHPVIAFAFDVSAVGDAFARELERLASQPASLVQRAKPSSQASCPYVVERLSDGTIVVGWNGAHLATTVEEKIALFRDLLSGPSRG